MPPLLRGDLVPKNQKERSLALGTRVGDLHPSCWWLCETQSWAFKTKPRQGVRAVLICDHPFTLPALKPESIYLCVHVCIPVTIHPAVRAYMRVCIPQTQSIHLCVCMHICECMCPGYNPSSCMFVCRTHPFTCEYVLASQSLSTCVQVYLWVSEWVCVNVCQQYSGLGGSCFVLAPGVEQPGWRSCWYHWFVLCILTNSDFLFSRYWGLSFL